MPDKKTLERARADARQGKSPSTQAGEFVREEIEHVREGKHGARSAKQAIAIGLSKARRAGVKLPAPKNGSRFAANPRKGKTRHRNRTSSAEAFPRPVAGHARRTEARRPAGRIAESALAAQPSGC